MSSNTVMKNAEIEALVDLRVQEKLHDLLKPLMNYLSANPETNIPGKVFQSLLNNTNITQQSKKAETTSDEQLKPKSILFLKRMESNRNESWHDPRKPQTPSEVVNTQHWLTVTKLPEGSIGPYEITIYDTALRDRIKRCLASFIAHMGENVWQRDEVVLVSELDTLLYNYQILRAEAHRQPMDGTSERLSELLDILRTIYDPRVFRCIDGDISRDFRTEVEFIWPLFCPGKLIVANVNGFDPPQLFRIDSCQLESQDQQQLTTIVVSAWMWDWDGQRLVRSMYDFRKQYPENTRVNPKEWTFYPVELYEAMNGTTGLSALREPSALRNKRRLFIQYTAEYAALNRGTNILRYSGDAFADAAAFPLSNDQDPRDVFLDRFFPRSRSDERPEKNLIKLDEDIVLDTINYCRRVGRGRKFANRELATSKFCECSTCMDTNTETWYGKMQAISNSTSANLESALQDAQDMEPNDNDLLLAPRVFGFALNKKEWCQFSLEKIQSSRTLTFRDEGARVEGLVFPPKMSEEERRDIFKLISDHKRVAFHSRRLKDTIDGKGESLILLFHGHSGTGKTLYAESLAKACKLGLFKVGTNDIGLEVAHAERRLREVFELAEAWNTILLIDEADVLLDARGKENESLVSKNALVSVLLREVEYFKGILIMTTNRVRAFDPAVLSRIHHAVDFEEATQQQEMALWDLWYDRMEQSKAHAAGPQIKKWMKDINRKKKRNFLSGREIRNVFLIAQVLAEEEGKEIKINLDELERAYQYRANFLAETEGKMNEAKAMVMSGMKH